MRPRKALVSALLGLLVLGAAPPATLAADPRLLRAQNLRALADLGPPRENANRRWTILSCLVGDNDLDLQMSQAACKLGTRARKTWGPRVPFAITENPALRQYVRESARPDVAGLLGKWRWQVFVPAPGTGQGGFAYAGLAIEFTRDAEDKATLRYETVSGARRVSGVARPEPFGLPVLSLFTRDGRGVHVRDAAMLVILEPSAGGGAPSLTLRDLGSPDFYRFVHWPVTGTIFHPVKS